MRLLLYNIRYATGFRNGFHLPIPYAGFFRFTSTTLLEIIDFIRSANPDIVALIEVDAGSYRSKHNCQADQIAATLGYKHIVETKYADNSLASRIPVLNKQSNAVLSRKKIIHHRFHYFDDGIKKLVIQADLEMLTIFIVHLSLKYRHRQNQLEHLHNLVKAQTNPVIVAGDFNTFWGSRELKLFLAATDLRNADPNNSPSHPSHAPKRQLDFILHSREMQITNFTIPDIQLSDHTPLICDFSCCDPIQGA